MINMNEWLDWLIFGGCVKLQISTYCKEDTNPQDICILPKIEVT